MAFLSEQEAFERDLLVYGQAIMGKDIKGIWIDEMTQPQAQQYGQLNGPGFKITGAKLATAKGDTMTFSLPDDWFNTNFIKHDTDKAQWSLLPWEVLEEVVQILTEGERKYPSVDGIPNYQRCTDVNRYFNAHDRHLFETRMGRLTDKESGKSHIAHAIANLLFAGWLEKYGK